jgi:transcriptional regulator with XRE-family HTH domain
MFERIKQLRHFLKLTQKQFAEAISTSPQNITKYEKGDIQPSSDLLSRMYKQFSVNTHWLLTGEGQMFVNDGCVCESPSYNTDNTDPEIDEMVELLKNMPAEKRHECLILCREKKLLFDIMNERTQKSKKQAG